jgi:serine/threonine protein phosphatase PrpC
VTAALAEHAALIVAVDGMAGHADGAQAAEVARHTILESFSGTSHPLLDPVSFLKLTLSRAHQQVFNLGAQLPLGERPRATCAVCLMQQRTSWGAHLGDSRIYHLRGRQVLARSRDHTHVEKLVRRGLITAEQAQTHPLRNFVECCLGGEPAMPEMSLMSCSIEPDDVFLVCTDGWWSGLEEAEIAGELTRGEACLSEKLAELAQRATARLGPESDNASAAALRWLAE